MPSALLFLTSQDRVAASTSTTDCTLVLSPSVARIKKAKLLAFEMPSTYYNIQTGVNDQFVWNRTAIGQINYQIPAGNYSITQLLSNIQAGMNAVDANNYVLTYSSTTTFKVTITGTTTFWLTWSSNYFGPQSCWKELGWTQADTSSSTTQTSVNAISLERPTMAFISIAEFGGQLYSSNSSYVNVNTTYAIPLTEEAGGLQYFAQGADFEQSKSFTPGITVQSLRIMIRDHSGNTLNVNGAEWSMLLGLELYE
jgi:hypothetical protein